MIPWKLRGFLLLNLTTALCVAPHLHKSMSTQTRCQSAMEGIILLDLFRLVADTSCNREGLPKGSRWIAPQTSDNLASVAMSMVVLAASKPNGTWDPFSQGHARYSELPIEEWFGHLRVQSSNAQLSARSYWRAAARKMIAERKKDGLKQGNLRNLPRLTPEQFQGCSKRAMQSALHLVSFCAGVSTASLEKMYIEWSENGSFDVDPFLVDFDMDEELDEPEPEQMDECMRMLWDLEEEARDQSDQPMPEADLSKFQLRSVPDAELLQDVIHAKASYSPNKPFGVEENEEKNQAISQPHTLHQALFSEADPNIWDRLWRLSMSLRHWGGGSDKHWVPNARSSRRASAGLSWHKCLSQH